MAKDRCSKGWWARKLKSVQNFVWPSICLDEISTKICYTETIWFSSFSPYTVPPPLNKGDVNLFSAYIDDVSSSCALSYQRFSSWLNINHAFFHISLSNTDKKYLQYWKIFSVVNHAYNALFFLWCSRFYVQNTSITHYIQHVLQRVLNSTLSNRIVKYWHG